MRLSRILQQLVQSKKARSQNKPKNSPQQRNFTGLVLLGCGVLGASTISWAVYQQYKAVRVLLNSPIISLEVELDK
jgi:hypothetical protein